MKKSVNGKSFDEIFAQLGKEVSVDEMVKRKVYFTDKASSKWSWIFVFAGLNSVGLISCNDSLPSDGEYEDWGRWFYNRDGRMFYEATQDQIDLLNLYKNEQ